MKMKSYSKIIGHFHQELKLKCTQFKIDLIDAGINNGFEQILLPYLLKRERMG